MNDAPLVQVLSRREEIDATFAVMKQLRPHLQRETYADTVLRMQASGFRLAALKVDGEVVAVAGYRRGESLAWGPHYYVDDLVTAETGRSRGHGKTLLDWLKNAARAEGCASLQLDSGVQRHDAHRFYLRERMNITSHHFGIALTAAR
jgi:GNAT superfamily N-acetyltransferase